MSEASLGLPELLSERVLVLDGALGTELERRGVPAPRPLWSAAALESDSAAIRQIHRDYIVAGADIIVADTFRTNVRTLRDAGMRGRGPALNRYAVGLVRQALSVERNRRQAMGDDPGDVFVAVSVAPVEDCYSPGRVPEEAVLKQEHAETLRWLKAARPDLVWIETMNTVREARAAAGAAADAGLPFVVSFVLRQDGELLSGERLEDAVAAVEPFNPLALGLNCIPPDGITAHLPHLRQATARPLAAYAHINNPAPTPGWSFSQEATPDQYARQVKRWLDLGVRIVGGCCGTTPAHIRAVRNVVHARQEF